MRTCGCRLIVAALLLAVVSATSVLGADNNWINSAGGLWEVPSNWSLGHAPQVASNDAPQIGVSGTYTVTVGSSAANAAPETFTNATVLVTTFGSGTPTLDFTYTNASTFRVNNSFDVGTGVVNWNATNGLLSAFQLRVAHVFGTTGTLNINAGQVMPNHLNVGGTGRRGIVNVNTNATLGFIFSTDLGSQAGGTAELNIHGGSLLWNNNGYLGSWPSSTGVITMTSGLITMNNNGHQMNIGGVPTVNGFGAIGRIIMSNGVWNTVGFVNLGAGDNTRGEMSVYGGTLTNITRPISVGHGASSIGSVLIAGTGVVWNARSTWSIGTGVGSLGTVTMSNGLVRITDGNVGMELGNGAGSRGELNLAGGSIITSDIPGVFDPFLHVGVASGGTGAVHVTGGLLQIDGLHRGLIIATNTGSTGRVTLDGGIVRLRSLEVGPGGVLSNRTGSVLQFADLDFVSGSGAKIVDGGTLSYRNYSALNVTGAVSKFTVVSGSGLQLDSSTNANITGTYTLANAANSFKELSLTGTNTVWNSDSLLVASGAQLRVTSGVNARTTSIVTNLGTIRVQNSTMTFEKSVTVNGRYISDPSTNTFNDDVTVGVSGTLEGGVGDLFDFKKSALIHSTNNQQFNLALSTVSFSGGGNHTNAVTGGDFGTNSFPAANFSYGTLKLGASDDVFFISGGSTNGGANANALYLDHLILGNNQSNLVENLHSSFNIYYMLSENQPGNAYLNDLTYSLDGGGFLMPVVPEPSVLALLVAAAALFVWRKRA